MTERGIDIVAQALRLAQGILHPPKSPLQKGDLSLRSINPRPIRTATEAESRPSIGKNVQINRRFGRLIEKQMPNLFEQMIFN